MTILTVWQDITRQSSISQLSITGKVDEKSRSFTGYNIRYFVSLEMHIF